MSRCAVIGAGSWGTAVSRHLALLGNDVIVWSHGQQVASGINERHVNPRYLSDVVLPEGMLATSDLAHCLDGADAVVFVVPSTHLREVSRACAPHMADGKPYIVLTKGIEPTTCELMIDVVSEEVGHPELSACLSGPNLAAEIAHDQPAGSVIASRDRSVGLMFQRLFHSERFRTYVSDDVIGVEVCGAAKNVVAIACGITKGVVDSDNTAAMVMTRGLAEMSRLVGALGGNPLTCMGLAGMGDLVATCTSPRSRNYSFGLSFSRGETLQQYSQRTHMVVEGYYACASLMELSRRLGVEAPLTQAIYSLLYEDAPLDDVIATLYAREPRDEFYGISTCPAARDVARTSKADVRDETSSNVASCR
jgi:glycerol-3-phosphate dehydrogenase (NAD(P)+)